MYGTLISTVTVGAGGVSTIDFTSIPGSFTDLKVVLSSRMADAGAPWSPVTVTLNGLSTNFTEKYLDGFGTGTASSGGSSVEMWGCGSPATAGTFGNAEMLITNYAGSTNKTISVDSVSENNGSQCILLLTAGLWSNTAAITRITLTGTNGLIQQYSSASLYGITKGSGGATVA